MVNDPNNGAPAPQAYHATADAARFAVELALPSIEAAMTYKPVGESGFLYIVIMNPLAHPHSVRFEDAILYEHSVGDPAKWDADYGGFARDKARLHWRTGVNTEMVQRRLPHLLQPGDTTLWGSASLDGIIVGVSGANPWYDEAFAGMVAHLFKGVIRSRAHEHEIQGQGTSLPSAGMQTA